MPEDKHGQPARRSHERVHLGGTDVAWTFEPIYNSPSEWNITARWMDYDPAHSPEYDVLDIMLIADEVRWRASELIALLFSKSRTLDQVRRALTLCDCMAEIGRAISPPRYVTGDHLQGPSEETLRDCERIKSAADRVNRTLRHATTAQGIIDDSAAHGLIPVLSELGELARTLYMRWYGEAGYGR
jgi:hypothetical protein